MTMKISSHAQLIRRRRLGRVLDQLLSSSSCVVVSSTAGETTTAGPSSQLGEAFFRDGAVVIRNALDPEAMALLREVYDFAFDNPSNSSTELLPDKDAAKAKQRQGGSGRIVKKSAQDFLAQTNKTDYDSGNGRAFVMNVNTNLSAHPGYCRLVSHPSIMKAIESLWYPSSSDSSSSPVADAGVVEQKKTSNATDSAPVPIYFFGEQLFMKEGNGAPITWHTDTADLPIAGPDLVTLWIPLEPTTRGLGGTAPQTLEFVRGSHRGFLEPDTETVEGREEISSRRTYNSAYGPHRGLAPIEIEAKRTDAERLAGTQGTGANIMSFDTQPGDIIAFHWAAFHGGGGTPVNVKRRTVALRYVGPRAFMSPRTTTKPEDRERWLNSKIHPFAGPGVPAYRFGRAVSGVGQAQGGSVKKTDISYGDRVQ